jgi:hypothetical protein
MCPINIHEHDEGFDLSGTTTIANTKYSLVIENMPISLALVRECGLSSCIHQPTYIQSPTQVGEVGLKVVFYNTNLNWVFKVLCLYLDTNGP